jgi:hypothetical protein
MLGRFIVSAGRLNEFDEALRTLPMANAKPWRLSALLDTTPGVARIVDFNARKSNSRNSRNAVVESVEVKAGKPADVAGMAGIIPREVESYFEVPLAGDEAAWIDAIAKCGRRAKIRTGGDNADRFPASAQVVEFVRLCAFADVPFKATAGLHHPIRAVHRLTYQADSPSALMHGFLNLFLMAVFVRAGMETGAAVELLEERSAAALHFDSQGIQWAAHRLSWQQIAIARRDFSLSFGSCSFTEPIDDLRSLGLL